MSLPTPIGRQKEVLYLPATGHIAVLGTAGSGKTTLAILRSAYLSDASTDHYGKTLLVTFNRALVTYLRHLEEGTLRRVVVENYHTFARGYLNSRNKMSYGSICSDRVERDRFIAEAIQRVSKRYEKHPVFSSPVPHYSDEFTWIAQNGITSKSAYRDAERIGRGRSRIQRANREVYFEIYSEYVELRKKAGREYDWYDLATAVCKELDADSGPRRYKHIVIDEGQDFSPEMIKSLAKAIPSDGSLTFFGDVVQQIYGQRMSWRSAGLQIAKVWEFQENYRNSKQIARLALAISKMPYYNDVADIVEPKSPTADGPLPTIVECDSTKKEIELIVSEAKKAAKTLTVAILFRSRIDESLISGLLPQSSIRLHRDMTTWQAAPGIRYGTYHSSKGLEFDMVILPFCTDDRLPDPELVANFGQEEASREDGRLLYVGVTRAKSRLIITHSGNLTRLLPVEPSYYEKVTR